MNKFFDQAVCNTEEDTPTRRIQRALEIAFKFSQFDGSHHKDWCNDQIVRALTGASLETEMLPAIDGNSEYVYEHQGTSPEYEKFIAAYRGELIQEDGYEYYEYEWSEGTPP